MAIYPEWVATDGGGTDPAASNGTDNGASAEATAPAGADGTTPSGADPTGTPETSPMAETSGSSDAGLPEAAEPADPEPESGPAPAVIPIDDTSVPAPTGWNDPLTGTDGPHYWDRLILSEAARVRRYKRSSTIVLVEIAGLTRLGRLWGRDVAERTLVSAARTLSQSIRTSDHIARIEPIRFGILLTETSEIDAINSIERARVSCERDLRVASEAVSVAFGWASPPKNGDLADAVGVATKRLEAELKEL
jgi:diguanylate cyclase (GGDEF)-like protein